jgi:lipooligosaccharide transport system permease protein
MPLAALRAYELWWMQYRRTWRGSLASTIVNPLLYLAALGVGLGTIVDRAGYRPAGVEYLQFVAPALLAAAAMQLATSESTWPVLGAMKWTEEYRSMLTTPLTVDDVLAGHQLWIGTRVLASSAIYLAVVAAFGAVASPLGLLVVPVAALLGLAFAAPIAAAVAWTGSESMFSPLTRWIITPMFLFAGTFFPTSRLPDAVRVVVEITPLWHGVELCRGLALGTVDLAAALGHAGYLLVWVVGGFALARVAYRRRLVR